MATEKESVYTWRKEQFEALGFPLYVVNYLADSPDVDLALVRKLIANGCPHDVAIRIAC